MENSKQSFSKLLEQYTFKVANLFIEEAEPVEQSEFIKLINSIQSESSLTESHTELLPDEDGESEWQQILNKPITTVPSHRLWQLDVIQKRIKHHEICIAQFEQAILTNRQHCQRIQNTDLREPYRSNIINQRKQALTYYQQRLATSQTAFQLDSKKLQQLNLVGCHLLG